MTPGARLSAAIEVLDKVLAGAAAERALTAWARGSRFAGSKDRAAVRDHVYDVLRSRRSLAAIGGAETGRALVHGLVIRQGLQVDTLFNGEGHAPAPLNDDERVREATPPMGLAESCDIPEWLWPQWEADLGAQATQVALAQQDRAPAYLRVNLRRGSREDAQAMLAADGVQTVLHPEVKTCLQVTENPRKVALSTAYMDGYVELQDAASQIAIAGLDVRAGARVLDYCAGGGGKALALADLHDCSVTAHDISVARMGDIAPRAQRAGVAVSVADTAELAGLELFDLVFCDAPCSGSGTWRRTPDAKWRLSQDKLNNYNMLQDEVLAKSSMFVRPGGVLVYATCSVLSCENDTVVSRLCARSRAWTIEREMRLLPGEHSDGFYLVVLRNQ